MSDTPKFTIVDRRKFRAEEDTAPSSEPQKEPAQSAPEEEAVAQRESPRLTLVERPAEAAQPTDAGETAGVAVAYDAVEDETEEVPGELSEQPALTAEEISFQRAAYEKAAQRLEDLVRAQNPAAPHSEKMGFQHLVQQLYLSAMMQMGAGTPEGQRPRIDILGARQTIDLLGVVLDKTRGNLSKQEQATIDAVIYELSATFVELTRMVSAPQPSVPPPGVKR